MIFKSISIVYICSSLLYYHCLLQTKLAIKYSKTDRDNMLIATCTTTLTYEQCNMPYIFLRYPIPQPKS